MQDRHQRAKDRPPVQAPPEHYYPGLSPQLLARIRQLWSAQGLDFDAGWETAVHNLPGFSAQTTNADARDSTQCDLLFQFDQCVIWIHCLQIASARGFTQGTPGLSIAQWHGLAGVAARLSDQMAALRVLALSDLPMPAMQIARALSEDVDMVLVLLIRPKLAQRFSDCRTTEDANSFWRRHIAGGRAFRMISEKLYAVGIDHSADSEYAEWRRDVLKTLGAAVHSNALQLQHPGAAPKQQALMNNDSLYFAAFRIHELCAFAQLLRPNLTELLAQTATAEADAQPPRTLDMAGMAAPLSSILVSQIDRLYTHDQR